MALFKSKAFWITVGTALAIILVLPRAKPTLAKLPIIGSLFV